jgi:hypothetical protein
MESRPTGFRSPYAIKLGMSIAGYFARRTAELHMPKTADPLGIRFEGAGLVGGEIRAGTATRRRYRRMEYH